MEEKCFKWPGNAQTWNQSSPQQACTLYSHTAAESACGIFSWGLGLDLVPVPQDGSHKQSQPSAYPLFSKRQSLPRVELDLTM